MRELLRDGRFRLLFAGQVASMAGDSVMILVLAIWVKDLTGASGLAGAVTLAIVAPALLSPLLGWAIDRVRRRPFLIWTNAVSAAALLPLLAVRDRADVWIIYAVALVYGLSFLLNSAGLAGLLKYVVAEHRLAEANAALRTVREGLRLVGPLAGAGLYAGLGAPAVVALDLASFLVAAGLAALALGLAPLVYPVVGLGLAAVPLAGIGVSLVVIAFATLMQRLTPQALMGRVSTATDLLIGAPQTVSIAAGAILVSTVDYRWMFATAAVSLVVVAGALWSRRSPSAGGAPVAVAPVTPPVTP